MAITLSLGSAWAAWSPTSAPGGAGASAASSVGAGPTPSVIADGSTVSLSWNAATLTTGHAVSGYTISRYDAATLVAQPVGAGCSGVVSATTCVETSVPTGQYKYTVTSRFATNWAGTESAKSATVSVNSDSVAPSNSVSLSVVSGSATLTGSTLYYRGSAPGSVTVSNAVTDAGSGPVSSTTSLTGTTTGWTHSGSTVSAPAGGPYVSAAFSWADGTSSNPTAVIVGRDVAGNAATTNLSLVNDSTAPALGTITYTDGFTAGRSVAVSFAAGVDAGSGVAMRQVQRATATLSNGSCGSYSGFSTISIDSASPLTDSAVSNSRCYKYRLVVTDALGNSSTTTSASVAKVDYAGAVSTTSGVLSHWRLGEAASSLVSADSLSGTAGALLSSRAGETGATWTQIVGNPASSAVFATNTNVNTVRHTTGGIAYYYTSGVPASADYRVEADVVVKSLLAGEQVGVVGRVNTAASGDGTFYTARYNVATSQWMLVAYVNGAQTVLGTSYGQTLTVGQAYRVALDMNGTTVRLLVDGVQRVTATTSLVAGPGRGGVRLANTNSGAASDSTGLHLRHFQITPSSYPRAADSLASNTGDFKGGPTLGAAGALTNDSNTAATFDGSNDYLQAVSTSNIPVGSTSRSVELWFKTTSSAQQTLFAYGSKANAQMFGLWLNPGGAAVTAWGWGTGNDFVFTLPSAANNGAWHQIVQTFNGTQLSIYYDGVLVNTVTATRSTVMDASGLGFGGAIPIGDGNSGYYFVGSLDEASFYSTALSSTTVGNHFALGASPAAAASTYSTTVTATSGLVNYYRLAETTTVSDSFAGTTGAVLSTRAGETGATWSSRAISGANANIAITNEGRIRKAGASTYGAFYTPSGTPSSANYTVSADVVYKSAVAVDNAGIVGRVDTTNTNGTYYLVRYEESSKAFYLHKVVNGVYTYLGGYAQTLTLGWTYRMSLDMDGSTIRMLINGVEQASVVDTGITAAGTSGVMLGFGYTTTTVNTTVSDTTGMHLDNFTTVPNAVDTQSTTNNGMYYGPTLGAASSLAGDTNAAASFDGVDDFISTNRQIGDDFSVEFLFKSTQGIGTGTGWWSGAGLVDADFPGQGDDFGVSLTAAGRILAGEGNTNSNIVSGSSGFNDGNWHHVVLTRSKATGVLRLYVDGVAEGMITGGTASLSTSATMSFGRINAQIGYFAGSLDEVALYNSVLSPSQVLAHHSAR